MSAIAYLIGFVFTAIYFIFSDNNSENKTEEIIEARGGLRKMYSQLFNAIMEMPESEILVETSTLLIATYLNGSGQRCKIEISLTRTYTFVVFKIRHNGKWVKTKQERFSGGADGDDPIMKIIFNFPDCGLSYRSSMDW